MQALRQVLPAVRRAAGPSGVRHMSGHSVEQELGAHPLLCLCLSRTR